MRLGNNRFNISDSQLQTLVCDFLVHDLMITEITYVYDTSIVIENSTKHFLEKVGWHFLATALET